MNSNSISRMAVGKINIRSLLRYSPKSPIAISIPPFGNQNSKSFSKAPPADRRNLIRLLQRYGLPHSEIPNFLKNNEFLLTRPEEIENSLNILSSLNPSRDFLISTVIACPSVLRLDFVEKWKLGITQVGIRNITSLATKNLLEIAAKLALTPDEVSRRVKGLQDLGFTQRTITRVLEIVPNVIILKEDQIQDKIELLMDIGIQKSEINRIFGLFPEITKFGVENRLKPLLNEFRDLGFSISEIRVELVKNPKILTFENGEFSQCLDLLRSLKCREAIKVQIYKDGELQAVYEVKMRVDYLRKHGLTYRDAFTVLWKEPRVVLYKIEDIEKKIEFLVCRMKFGVECLVEVPGFLGVSFDKRIVPRFNVIEYLRARGGIGDGIGDEVGLRSMVKLSRLWFYNMYVKPYPECEKIYGRFGGDCVVRSHHPVGMWKLFRPKKHLASDQDVENIKSYVESFSCES